ncbi:tyrosine/serine/threonine protein phosphatase pps1 [Tilletia horrida]|uniref:Tyrosine/serine/threonine protein phosphatase pps1 n=1 Tax=Tilletia horrida TaxID=155126 RepID=A0AAN6GWB3_9BASI|nr:tyrosine/serine/threonine protein phosphatase pps1 [Tilletia horrida]
MAASSVSLHPVASRGGQQSAEVVSFQLSDTSSSHQAKAQANASVAAAYNATGSVIAADGWQPPAFESASAPLDSIPTEFGQRPSPVLPGQSSNSISASMPTNAEHLEAHMESVSSAPEWGVRHADIDIYPCLSLTEAQQQQSSIASSSNPLVHAPFKKAASWCAAGGLPMAYTASQMAAAAEQSSQAPIRMLTATQFARMYEHYLDQDVPHHVVFPFLHGVDGDNPGQNVFFSAPLGGQPTPRYRGITIVRADMPTPQAVFERLQSYAQTDGEPTFAAGVDQSFKLSGPHYGGASLLSGPKSDSSCSSGHGSDESGTSSDDSRSSGRDHRERESSNSMYEHFAANLSMASSNTTAMSHISGQSFFEDKIANQSFQSDTASSFSTSPNPVPHSAGKLGMDTSSSSEPLQFGQAANEAHCAASTSFSRYWGEMLSQPYEPQPPHSILNSTLYPAELLILPEPAEKSRQRAFTSASSPPSPSPFSHRSMSNTASSGAASESSGQRKATFAKPAQATGVSLRNFKIQAAKYATISDIVVYCPAGLHSGAIELAQHFRDAQEAMYRERQERGLGGLQYNVFVVTDAFETFEKQFDFLVAVDGQGRERHTVNFIDREREEMQRLTRATEIETNVWLGCSRDVPPLEEDEEEFVDAVDRQNPHGFSFCIEAHEMAFMPGYDTLRQASHYLNSLEDMASSQTSKESDAHQGGDYFSHFDGIPDSSTAAAHDTLPVLHLECAAGSQSCNSNDSLNRMADSVIDLCAWIKAQAQPASVRADGQLYTSGDENVRERRFLIHCGDGYTETSLLALSYLMLARNLTLPEAYLDMQHRANRSFFVYARDLPLLKRVDEKLSLLRLVAQHQQQQMEEEAKARSHLLCRGKAKHSFAWLSSSNEEQKSAHAKAQSEGAANADQPSWAKSIAAAATGLVSPSNSMPGQTSHRKTLSFASATSAALARNRHKRSATCSSELGAQLGDDSKVRDAWFHNPRFEGSFPSRILPFLYLGNIAHAMNADMLHALGITHVVSVGESALHPPPGECNDEDWMADYADPAGAPQAMPGDSALWREMQAGRIDVLDLKNVSDDGIDPLRATMCQSVEYIERARRAGGKVLVHCRVGVSRSATIVLAYVMAHLDLGLVEAYLLVRSRRLNILIQPHLLFFWELRGWEKVLADKKAQRAGEATPACSALQPVESGCDELQYKDVDEEMTDADAPSPADADERAFSMAALSLCSFHPSSMGFRGFASSNKVSPSTSHSVTAAGSPIPAQVPLSGFGDQQNTDLDIDFAAGAGSVYGVNIPAAHLLPFGSGSPSGVPYKSLRLTWGFLCREIAALNQRYFV